MSPKERSPLSEATSGQVYSKAREILDLHGHPGTKPTIRLVPRPGGRPRITRGEDIPITETPIVPIQIAGNDYRLWLRTKDNKPSDRHTGGVKLSIHFQKLPYGLDRVEYDSADHVTGYWYKPKDKPELLHVTVSRSFSLPKELEFSWYIAKTYSIGPNTNSSEVLKNVRPEIVAGLGDSNDFLLTILEKIQTGLKGKLA